VKGVITSSLKMILPASIVLSLALFILSPYIAVHIFHSQELAPALMIFSLSLPFSSITSAFVAAFVGFQRIKYKIYLESIALNLGKLVFIVVFGLLGYGLLGMSWAWVLSTMIVFVLSFYYLQKTFPIVKTKITSIKVKRELVVYSFPLLLSSFMIFAIRQIDTIMLGYFRTATEVGIYNAAMPTAQLLNIIPSAMTALFLPTMTALYVKRDSLELKRVYKTVTRWIFYINFPIFLLLLLFSRQVLNVMFGPEYVGGSMALVLLSVGFMTVKSVPAMQMLQMLKKTKTIMAITIVNLSINIILNWLLIPPLGVLGAAIATMTTYIIYFSLYFIFSHRFTGVLPLSSITLKSLLAGLVSIGIVHIFARTYLTAFPIHVMAGLFLAFIAIYGSLLLVIGGVNKEDIEIMKAMERKSGMRISFLRRIFKKFA
jgi:O-antigen/teichoic acid export membrane protein